MRDNLAARRVASARKRRIILNNDGNEPVYLSTAPTPEEILAYRTAPFVGSQVDTVFYCTWSSGFGLFTHLTDVGQVFTTTEAMFRDNKMQAFAEAGVDPLHVMNRFCHENEIEFFWSMRMNDTHDGQGADYAAVMLRANRLKTEHPEFLIGTEVSKPRYGNWTAVDYGREEIRELAFRYVEEVCTRYDVDGVELDFFRHPVYFQGPARGFPATGAEREMMTSLVRRIRGRMDEQTERRGRPILLAVRAPDNVEYCRQIGLDIEAWFAEDLVDLYVPSGYVRLSPWVDSVRLAHRYGVSVYPALDESRVVEEGEHDVTAGHLMRPRGRYETYRARASEVLASGADGVYLYNYFDPKSPILREIGEMATMEKLSRTYYASYLGAGRIAGDGFPHEPFMRIPALNPGAPIPLYPGRVERLPIGVYGTWDDGAELALQFREVPAAEGEALPLQVALNGEACSGVVVSGQWCTYPGVHGRLRAGANWVELRNPGPAQLVLTDCFIRVDG